MKGGYLASLLAVAAMVVVLTMDPVETCNEVRSRLFPCFSFVSGEVAAPSDNCCNQVRNLNSQSRAPEERRAACTCLKHLATTTPGVKPERASQLPQQCRLHGLDSNQNCESIP